MQFDGAARRRVTPGMPADAIYTVTEVYPDHVVLDGNHPLAGMALRLDVVGARRARGDRRRRSRPAASGRPRSRCCASPGAAAALAHGGANGELRAAPRWVRRRARRHACAEAGRAAPAAAAASTSGVVTGPLPLKRSSAR